MNIFFFKSIAKLFEYIKINYHFIELIKKKKLLDNPIYNLEPIKLKILKIYIKINKANGLINPLKFLASISILLIKKLDDNFCSYIDYYNFTNLIIKNWYLLYLISQFFI